MPVSLPKEVGLVISDSEVVYNDGYVALAANIHYSNGALLSHLLGHDSAGSEEQVIVRILENVAQIAKDMDLLEQDLRDVL